MADLKASRFISALVKNLQAVCHGHVEFDENIKVVGHLFLTVDSGTEFNYILNEKVSKTDHSSITFISRSFHAIDAQQKADAKPPPQNDRLSSQDQRRFWQNQNKTGFPESKQKANQQPQTQVPSSRDNRTSAIPGPSGLNVLQPLHRQSPKRTMSPQNFSNKVPRFAKSDAPSTSQANRSMSQDYENITISDTCGMSADENSDNDDKGLDVKIRYTKAQEKLIMQQALSKMNSNKTPFEQELALRDSKQKSAPNVNCPVSSTASSAGKVSHSQPSVSAPMSVAKSVAHPSSSTHTITTPSTPSTSSSNPRAQVVDVDLTRVKEEPQDAGYGESVSNAASANYPQDQNWHQDHAGPSGEGEYEEGYEGEGYEGEEYEGEYDEEGYEGEEYFQEGYEGEEYDEEEYEEGEMHEEEFMNHGEDNDGNVGVYPVGFLHSASNHESQGGMATGSNQNLMNQQMTASQQQMQSGLSQGFQQPNMTKQGGKFECQYCQKDFSSSANLTRHIQSQHFAARVHCPICDLTFARKETLKKHIFKKHPGGETSCPICEEMFSSVEQMNKHVFELHRVNPSFS